MFSANRISWQFEQLLLCKIKVLGTISSYIGVVSFSYDRKQFMNSFSLYIDKKPTATKKIKDIDPIPGDLRSFQLPFYI